MIADMDSPFENGYVRYHGRGIGLRLWKFAVF